LEGPDRQREDDQHRRRQAGIVKAERIERRAQRQHPHHESKRRNKDLRPGWLRALELCLPVGPKEGDDRQQRPENPQDIGRRDAGDQPGRGPEEAEDGCPAGDDIAGDALDDAVEVAIDAQDRRLGRVGAFGLFQGVGGDDATSHDLVVSCTTGFGGRTAAKPV